MPKRTRRQKPAKHIIPTRKKAMRVLIIGGGFCGTDVAKKLDNHEDIQVTLFNPVDYFEYIPSVHKLMFHPEYHKRIIIPFKKILHANIVTDPVASVTPKAVKTKRKSYVYDALAICSGIDYPIFLENKKNVFVLKVGEDGKKIAKALKKSKTVIVIGGGLIGTEVAGEISSKSNKKLIVVHPKDRLLERNPPRASAYALKFLKKHGAEVIFGEKVVQHKDGTFITDKGRQIEADMGIWCAGIKADPRFMKGFPPEAFTQRNALEINKFMQLQGSENIFVGGDISGIVEEKTAQNAERHAKIIAENILRLKDKEVYEKYEPHSGPLVISLDDWHAIMVYKGWTLNGIIPGLLKWLIEYWTLFKFRFL